MGQNYQGLPAAATVEQAIILAQRLIRKELERQRRQIPKRPDQADPAERPAA